MTIFGKEIKLGSYSGDIDSLVEAIELYKEDNDPNSGHYFSFQMRLPNGRLGKAIFNPIVDQKKKVVAYQVYDWQCGLDK